MGDIVEHKPVMLITAVTSRHDSALAWTIEQTSRQWGGLCLQSPVFDFTETDFYTESMGTRLKKQLLAFDNLISPGEIAPTKIVSNAWENRYAERIRSRGNSTSEYRSRIYQRGQTGVGNDQGSRPSNLPATGDLCRSHAVLPQRSMDEQSLDLSGLPAGRFSGILYQVS